MSPSQSEPDQAVTLPPTDAPPLHLALPPPLLAEQAASWLREDAPSLDPAAAAVGNAPTTATLYAKSSLVLAGLPFFRAVFDQLGCTVNAHYPDSTSIRITDSSSSRVPLAVVSGPANLLLHGERTALNALAECSAVATIARRAVTAARAVNWHGSVAGTRKTAPGLRVLQKYAMIVGGMDPHRVDLSGMSMIKDNHIRAAGGIPQAVRAAKTVIGFSAKIDVEAENETEAVTACEAGADVVMLDNFDPLEFARVAKILKSRWPHVLVEASGGLTIDTLHKYCIPEADVISFSINRYATPVDLSLKID